MPYQKTLIPGWKEVIHSDDYIKCSEAWENSLRTGEDYEVEHRLKKGEAAKISIYGWMAT